jgi:hypothetical protein
MSAPAQPTDGLVAIHTALIAALDDTVSCPVWDAVPPGAVYPYVTVDGIESSNADFLAHRMDQRFIYLNIWSDVPGQAEVMQIMSEIDTLNEQFLETSGPFVVSVRVERKRTARDVDNLTYQGTVTLRLFIRHEGN